MKEQDYLDIEAYLQGELSSAEAAALEARTAAEPALVAALAERRLLNDHLRADGGEPALKKTLSQLTIKHFGKEQSVAAPPLTALSRENESGKRAKGHPAKVRSLKPRKTNWLIIAASAAAILLLLVFGGRVFFNDQGSTYEQFAQHQPLSLTERGDGDNGITTAEAAFNDGRYEEAIAPLQQYVQLNQDDARARLALGISYLETGDNAEAVRILTEVAENGGSLAPYGNWYLALAAMHRDDNSAALRYIDLIPAEDSFLKERVLKLREVLAD